MNWSISGNAGVDGNYKMITDLWKPEKEEVIFHAVFVFKTKIKGKQYSRPFIWNRTLTGKAKIIDTKQEVVNDVNSFELTLQGIGEPTE